MLAGDMISYLEEDGLIAIFYDAFRPAIRQSRVLVVTPYPGSPPIFVHGDADSRVELARFQIEALDQNPAVAEALAVDATNRLARIRNREIDGTWYLSVFPVLAPAFLKHESELERFSYVASFEATKAISVVEASS